jgi:RHS repeat-associated protein
LHDSQNPVQELSGSVPVANLITGSSLDEFIVRTDMADASTYLMDVSQNVVALADSMASVSTEYTYDPFGFTTSSGSASSNEFRFTGRESDTSDLYYYRSRYYSPGISRFLSEDPMSDTKRISNVMRQKDEWNPYVYARNDPRTLNDPEGTLPSVFPVWPGNGNLGGDFQAQNGYCDIGGSFTNNSKCLLKCCAEHDQCYTDWRCNQSSWLTTFVAFSPCGACNIRAGICFLKAAPHPRRTKCCNE